MTALGRNYDISPDGSRFAMVKRGKDTPASTEPLRVVLNWAEELKRASELEVDPRGRAHADRPAATEDLSSC